MPETKRPWSDEQVEKIVGSLLRTGVIAAAVIVLAGAILYVIRYGASMPDYSVFRGEPAEFRSVGGILRAAFQFRSRGLIQLGLLLLIATPVARVAFSIFAFALERDRVYIAITLIVLGILLYSLAGGGL
ncbi:MAG: DUF1634 domain-containing protein [Thermodesulfobacteriota bacterium]